MRERIEAASGGEYARVVCDSVAPHGRRIVTVEACYWRMIHSEIMTHRDRARNAASSRAIPFYREAKCKSCEGGEVGKYTPSGNVRYCEACGGRGFKIAANCMYGMVEGNPFVPEFIGKEQRGMQAGGEIEGRDRDDTVADIIAMRDFCLERAKRMADRGVHKSICNRYLEPWMRITVVMTATEWANFFRLRIHPKAERHFDKVARLIQRAIDESVPDKLEVGQWHLPYIHDHEYDDVWEWMKINRKDELDQAESENADRGKALLDLNMRYVTMISAARCARLSYLTHDGRRDFGDDLKLFAGLIDPKRDDGTDDDAIHASALEHTCQAHADPDHRSGPMSGWHQLRKNYPRENVSGM